MDRFNTGTRNLLKRTAIYEVMAVLSGLHHGLGNWNLQKRKRNGSPNRINEQITRARKYRWMWNMCHPIVWRTEKNTIRIQRWMNAAGGHTGNCMRNTAHTVRKTFWRNWYGMPRFQYVATPRHNGKVERQRRIDEARFYKHMKMYNLKDGRRQLAVYQRKSNNYIKTCLGMKTPDHVVRMYQEVMF